MSPQELSRRIANEPRLVILDATYFLPLHGKNAREEFEKKHVPGAIFWDIDAISDLSSPHPHLLPDEARFAKMVGALGISDQDDIVIYDQSPLRSAARAWWSLHIFGAKNVSVLDGGLAAWQAQGLPVESGHRPALPHKTFTARLRKTALKTIEEVKVLLNQSNQQIIDARPEGRYRGSEPEPRPGLRSGHIPGAKNLPFSDLFDPTQSTYLPIDQLEAVFERAKITLKRPITAHCGSGITACPVLFAAYLCGAADLALYGGSWIEWGAATDTPVEK